jgi:hypothetical protein
VIHHPTRVGNNRDCTATIFDVGVRLLTFASVVKYSNLLLMVFSAERQAQLSQTVRWLDQGNGTLVAKVANANADSNFNNRRCLKMFDRFN